MFTGFAPRPAIFARIVVRHKKGKKTAALMCRRRGKSVVGIGGVGVGGVGAIGGHGRQVRKSKLSNKKILRLVSTCCAGSSRRRKSRKSGLRVVFMGIFNRPRGYSSLPQESQHSRAQAISA